ncbi:MAG: NAD(P)-dependent oxidoreductase [Anaerolineae bacterium]|nr:NAD(P)-dependent oxidoreductase [Anaerolineae bacterium]
MKIAVTGGSGRIGRVLTRLLVGQQHEVVSIDRSVPDDVALIARSAAMITSQSASSYANEPIRFVEDDLMDVNRVKSLFDGCHGVIHLAAIPTIRDQSVSQVYINNTAASYNVLLACAELGIHKVCLASSINAIGGIYSRQPKYDYFPVDEQHPTYNEDAYSLSKWVLEAQADSFARRYEDMTICSLRFHAMIPSKPGQVKRMGNFANISKDLWAYTNIVSGARACLMALQAEFKGHEAFFITAPQTAVETPSLELAQAHYPDVPVVGDLSGRNSFYSTQKAERLLGWKHEDLEI